MWTSKTLAEKVVREEDIADGSREQSDSFTFTIMLFSHHSPATIYIRMKQLLHRERDILHDVESTSAGYYWMPSNYISSIIDNSY